MIAKKSDVYYIFFQLQLLIYLGYQPNFLNCNNCNQIINDGIFNTSVGHLYCSRCSINKNISITSKELKTVQFLMSTHIDKLVLNYDFKDISFNKINRLLYKFFIYHLPELQSSKPFKRLQYNG